MISISCNSEFRGGGVGDEGFCCKLIDSNNDLDAVCSASISNS